ncbi:MAG: hypothetical protein CMO55_12785 [Verrucomicrobiales bacterium]|nr:hypothetical protein [Verrucomicrobiales bacterium]
MVSFEFLVPKRPLSHQAKSSAHKNEWRDYVYGRAFREWQAPPIYNTKLRLTIVYICEEDPPDINNIIKPVQDSLSTLVYSDDLIVCDVQGSLRMVDDLIDLTGLPPLLQDAILIGFDCLYIRIDRSRNLRELV